MQIDTIDLHSATARDELEEWVSLRNVVQRDLFGMDSPMSTLAMVQAMAARDDQGNEFFLAREDDGRAVAAARLATPGPTGASDAEISLFVHPQARRGGVGAAVVARLEERARELGCARTILDQMSPRPDGAPGAGFARRLGYTEVDLVLGSRLDLPVSEEVLASLERTAREAYDAAYELSTAWDDIPDEWVQDRAELATGLSSYTPAGSIEDDTDETWDAERVRALFLRWNTSGGRVVETIVVVRDTAHIVAYSDLVVYGVASAHPHAAQSDTLVHPEHRGHKLGIAVKVANLRALARDEPEVDTVFTWTSPDNAPMNALNALLGFRTVAWTRMWARDLGAA
ncbi:MAG: GNAT family N-acetyltransferase [Tetrasphaera sp.]|nr:GNAT family N-acetyltransferase [Tetrasphaera sp.]